MRPAVFIDRDGTLIELVHYLADPADVLVLPGAAEALMRLRDGGFAIVVVTNQSIIGRGLLDEAGLTAVHAAMHAQLASASVQLDGVYHCPFEPTQRDPTTVDHDDRKPGPGMLLRAARELSLDLSQSYMVGDNVSDTLAGHNAGCRASILVRTGHGMRMEAEYGTAVPAPMDHVVDDLAAAADLILRSRPHSNRP